MVGSVMLGSCIALGIVFGLARSSSTATVGGSHRVFYLAAEEIQWDYLPHRASSEFSDDVPREEKEKTIYKKAVFKEYTDETYSLEKPHSSYLGVLGPILKAEVGDTMEIHLLNRASHPVSLHAHTVLYAKEHEGAVYKHDTGSKRIVCPEGSPCSEIVNGDKIPPLHNYTYHWQVPEGRGPTDSDENCILSAYHSHVTGETDIHTGLVGPIIICKKGHLNDKPPGEEFVLMFLIFDENESWYNEENLMANHGKNSTTHVVSDDDTEEENQHKMYSVNGYVANTLPELQTCEGSEINWYLMGMGNEEDIHSVTFAGHSLEVYGHRTDIVHLYPAKFVTAKMKSRHQGVWSIKSEVDGDSSEASMKIVPCSKQVPSGQNFQITRKYYIAAEEKYWKYYLPPNDSNQLVIDDAPTFTESSGSLSENASSTYLKVQYVEYEDESFSNIKVQPASQGILGPTLRVEIGEILEIHFLNRASRAYSIQSSAFVCDDCSDGSAAEVQPGENTTLRFHIDENLAPTAHDPQCVTWRYSSGVDPIKDSNSGLNGVLLTCKQGTLDNLGNQKFVGSEHTLMFASIDESDSHYSHNNSHHDTRSEKMNSINGFTHGSLPRLELCAGENNGLHIITNQGSAEDLHVVRFVGNRLIHHGVPKEAIELLPGGHMTAFIEPESLGTYLLRSETSNDIQGGMRAVYDVIDCHLRQEPNIDANPNSGTKHPVTYYIAAVEVEWDYAPSMINPITGVNLTENENSEIFVRKDATHIGSKYRKVVYREYTDGTFTQEKAKDERLGLLGPVIKAEIGDRIHVHFMNKAARGSFNLRPHGLSAEDDNADVPIGPGGQVLLKWAVPASSGPGDDNSFRCSNWMYYSTVNTVKDTNSGLIGPLVICKPGTLNEDGTRNDVDKEFSVLFSVSDENKSWFLENNIQEYCSSPLDVKIDDEDFMESNKIHGINGLIYGNLKGLSGKVGDKVAWYLMGFGSEIDLHTAHFHGLSVVEKDDATLPDGRREDVVDLFPGVSRTVQMTMDNPGSWLFHCHVDDHLKAGMYTTVTVNP